MRFFFASAFLAANLASAQLARLATHHQQRTLSTELGADELEVHLDMSMSMSLPGADAIFGGAQDEKPDYLVSIVVQALDVDNRYQDCSGVLISRNVVLTTGGCIIRRNQSIEGVIGYVDFNRNDIAVPEEAGIARYFFADTDVVFPDGFNQNDIVLPEKNLALIFLREDAPTSATTIKLDTRNNVPTAGDTLQVKGWNTVLPSLPPVLPSTLDVNYLSNAECQAEVDRLDSPFPPLRRVTITDDLLCANAAPGTGTCLVDDGSPLILDDELVGIWNFPLLRIDDDTEDFETCALEFPTVYTRISSYSSWIMNTVCGRTGSLCGKKSKASKSMK